MKAIKKIWVKFETVINKTIEFVIKVIVFVYTKVVPQKIRDKIDSKNQNLKSKVHSYKDKIVSKIPKRKPREKIEGGFIAQIKYYLRAIRRYASIVVNSTKKIDIKSVDFWALFKNIIGYFYDLIKPIIDKFQNRLKAIDHNTIVISVVFFATLILIILGILKSGRTIYQGVKDQGKSISQVEEKAPDAIRESYYQRILPAKQLNVYEVTLPIYIDSINSVRTLLMDLTLETSNRYTREYLHKHSYLIKDRLNNTIHPIIPDFPLTLEGKTIIREKVIFEINKLLKEEKIQGEIKKVSFQTIIAA